MLRIKLNTSDMVLRALQILYDTYNMDINSKKGIQLGY